MVDQLGEGAVLDEQAEQRITEEVSRQQPLDDGDEAPVEEEVRRCCGAAVRRCSGAALRCWGAGVPRRGATGGA